MGQCGCGDFTASYRLPGPDGAVYALRTYLACNNGCNTPHSVIVYRFSSMDEAARWGVDRLPVLEFGTFDSKPYEGNDAWLPVLHPEGLVEDAVENCLAEAVIATIERAVGEAALEEEPDAAASELTPAPSTRAERIEDAAQALDDAGLQLLGRALRRGMAPAEVARRARLVLEGTSNVRMRCDVEALAKLDALAAEDAGEVPCG